MASGYEYEPLDSNRAEIGVLWMPAQELLDSRALQCEVLSISLLDESLPKYMAISHAWGDIRY